MIASQPRVIQLISAGLVEYQAAWEWQRRLAAERSAGGPDTLLLLEHPPTITLGNKAGAANVLASPAALARRGVALVQSDRGGDVTYHAPGQLVGYPILKLSQHGGDVGRYVRNLEEVVIRTLARYTIVGGRVPGLSGVWVNGGRAKICALGVKLSAGGITSHGIALNVSIDLAGFDLIVPCGIAGRGVTSIAAQLGHAPPPAEVADAFAEAFAEVFAVELEPIPCK